MGVGRIVFVLGVGRGCESPLTMMLDASAGMDIDNPLTENGESPGMMVLPAMMAAVEPWIVPLIVWVPAVMVKGANGVFGCGVSFSWGEDVGVDDLGLLSSVESPELLLGESVLP